MYLKGRTYYHAWAWAWARVFSETTFKVTKDCNENKYNYLFFKIVLNQIVILKTFTGSVSNKITCKILHYRKKFFFLPNPFSDLETHISSIFFIDLIFPFFKKLKSFYSKSKLVYNCLSKTQIVAIIY